MSGDVAYELQAMRIGKAALQSELPGAEISEDGHYRYALWRVWEVEGPAFLVIGLNPSTADASNDDPTIRRCVAFAKREGCGRLVMLNLFAFRATDPQVMLKAAVDRVGPLNDATLKRICAGAVARGGKVVAAWGVVGDHNGRDRKVLRMLADGDWPVYPLCLGRTAGGHPRHPLYLRKDAPLEPLVTPPHPDARSPR